MPLGLGYLHLILLFGCWIVNVEHGGKFPIYEGTSFGEYLKHTAKTIAMKLVGIVKAIGSSIFGTIVLGGIEALLWVCYILLLVKWIFMLVLGIPLIVVMYCFTNLDGFVGLVIFIMVLYCFKQCCCPKGVEAKKANEERLIEEQEDP